MIDTIKLVFYSILFLAVLGLFGYWAISHLQSGSQFAADQKIQTLQQENDSLTKQVADLTDQLSALQPPSTATTTNTPPATTPTNTQPTTYKYQNLMNQLQQLVTGNVYMKLKSSGTTVATVQNFLNIYNNTSNKIDNSYGAGTAKAVADFQKAQGLTADGQAGANTFNKMISWLKQQG